MAAVRTVAKCVISIIKSENVRGGVYWCEHRCNAEAPVKRIPMPLMRLTFP